MGKQDETASGTEVATTPTPLATDQATGLALVSDLNESMPALFDDDALGNITSFDDAMNALAVAPEDVNEYGNGFDIVEDKRTLIGVPFVVLQWRFSEGDYGVFVSAAIVTEDGRKLILNDGSTGIREFLETVTRKRVASGHQYPRAGLTARKGLRVSDYEFIGDDGKAKPASTFYFA